MTRLLTAFGLVLTAAASFGLYQVKYQVQDMDRNLASMKRQIERDRAEMQVLDAEWSFLNQPQRLQGLASRYLTLGPIRPTQMVSIESLPPRGASVLAAAPSPGSAPAVPPALTLQPAAPKAPSPEVRPAPSAPARSAASALMISGGSVRNEDITPINMGDGE